MCVPLLLLCSWLLLFQKIGFARALDNPPSKDFREYQLFPSNDHSSGSYHPWSLITSDFAAPAAAPSPPPPYTVQHPEIGARQASTESTDVARNEIASSSTSVLATTYPHPESRFPKSLQRLPWSRQGRSSSEKPSHLIKIMKFSTLDGERYGPFHVGSQVFEARKYPLDIPFFQHLYSDVNLIPANFEEFPVKGRRIQASRIFHPEPEILSAIQITLQNRLNAWGFTPKRVVQHSDLMELEYLWPPVDTISGENNLGMSRNRRGRLHSSYLGQIMPSHQQRMMHLRLKVGGQDRHILMTPLDYKDYTDLRANAIRSKLWLFSEGFIKAKPGETPMLAVLGGTFLPAEAIVAFRGFDQISPAFMRLSGLPNALTHAHR
ncbi:uncharacterized protein UTRI_10675 [Ustilago trichophora]|uniref:Effector family protein Eff1 n=1 Tax=Ustilago trichophora TaxID=86804 RepID=A0A5C3E9S6_9BASI|nr:uncharacterized protein UTRI_10675 [Ustilago trichophora]